MSKSKVIRKLENMGGCVLTLKAAQKLGRVVGVDISHLDRVDIWDGKNRVAGVQAAALLAEAGRAEQCKQS